MNSRSSAESPKCQLHMICVCLGRYCFFSQEPHQCLGHQIKFLVFSFYKCDTVSVLEIWFHNMWLSWMEFTRIKVILKLRHLFGIALWNIENFMNPVIAVIGRNWFGWTLGGCVIIFSYFQLNPIVTLQINSK